MWIALCNSVFDPPMNYGGGLRIPIFFSEFQYMAPTIFAEFFFLGSLVISMGMAMCFLIGLGSEIGSH